MVIHRNKEEKDAGSRPTSPIKADSAFHSLGLDGKIVK